MLTHAQANVSVCPSITPPPPRGMEQRLEGGKAGTWLGSPDPAPSRAAGAVEVCGWAGAVLPAPWSLVPGAWYTAMGPQRKSPQAGVLSHACPQPSHWTACFTLF